MSYLVAPITVKAARQWVADVHRHLPRVQGGLFAVAVRHGGQLVGVGIAGNPARVWQGTGRIVIREVWTYTLPGEPGTSLLAAGFTEQGKTKAEQWSRPSRERAPSVNAESKRRWMIAA